MELQHQTAGRRWLGRYELLGEIASGGMARVFLARVGGVGGFQRLFAVKRLHDHLVGESELVRMFLDEARLAGCLHHPSVVPILELVQAEGTFFLVMPYVEGDTVAGLLATLGGFAPDKRGGPLPIPTVLRIVLDALAGLHAAHELVDPAGLPVELVHRDCSPQNILVGVDGVSRIIDFGVARAASRLSTTCVGLLKGKLAYMSPEQVRGDERLDRRSDIFAMGIVLWELLSGRRLFKSETERATLTAVLERPVPALRPIAPAVPAGVEDVCLRALNRDRDERYATAADMAAALEAAVSAPVSDEAPRAIASRAEVAELTSRVLAPALVARRATVREWLAHPPSTGASVESAGAQATPSPEAAPSRSIAPVVVAANGVPRRSVPPDTRATWSTAPIVVRNRSWLAPGFVSVAVVAALVLGIACAATFAARSQTRLNASIGPDAAEAGHLVERSATSERAAAPVAPNAPAASHAARAVPSQAPAAVSGASKSPADDSNRVSAPAASQDAISDDLVNPYRDQRAH